MKRREFLARAAAASAGLSLVPGLAHAARLPLDDPEYRELALRALDAAKRAGAS
jgi:TldD protein